MREIFNFLNFGKKKKKEKEKRNIEVSKIFNFGNLKRGKFKIRKTKYTAGRKSQYFRSTQLSREFRKKNKENMDIVHAEHNSHNTD